MLLLIKKPDLPMRVETTISAHLPILPIGPDILERLKLYLDLPPILLGPK